MKHDFDHELKKALTRLEKMKALDKLQLSLDSFFYDHYPAMRNSLMRLFYMAYENKKRLDKFYVDGVTLFYRKLSELIKVISYVHKQDIIEIISMDENYSVAKTNPNLETVKDLQLHYRFLEDWQWFPMYLTLEQIEDPIAFIEDFFSYQAAPVWQQNLDDLFDAAIAPRSVAECIDAIENPIKLFIYFMRLMDASYLIKLHIDRIKPKKGNADN